MKDELASTSQSSREKRCENTERLLFREIWTRGDTRIYIHDAQWFVQETETNTSFHSKSICVRLGDIEIGSV
ncbi:hypothetical protein TorRG33x02_307980 [Trema orientale]|uniref:Uncharacterized protein n=1 Tax=Trema orientale TaxID=63057 RepID=A0A2P5BUT2_TREOI|nr:hypothetical protein TorRG33x02_307980 [Trema orientale]